jgi:hypothetical protein
LSAHWEPAAARSTGNKVPDQQLAAYVRFLSLPQTLAAETDGTPSQVLAPVPPEVDHDAGCSPLRNTTNDYTTTALGPK